MILGAMRVCDFPLLPLTVGALADAVDKLIFLVDSPEGSETLSLVTNHPKTARIAMHMEKGFHQGRTYRTLFKLAEGMGANYIFYPDEDELLPDREDLLRALKQAEIKARGRPVAAQMRMVYCWGNENTVALTRVSWLHCKAASWSSDLPDAFLLPDGRGVGHCKPQKRVVGTVPYPFRHLCRMTPDLDARWEQHGVTIYGRRAWPGEWPPTRTAPWNPKTTAKEWVTIMTEARSCRNKT